ncbi:MAG: hypothetical protein PW791_09150 [Neorhizobium sp.]|nr:hypothetical protein [Neorhizobium sp.]
MSDKLRIASKSPLPLRMEVMNDDGTISSQVINPASALPGAPEAVTEDVDADLYHAWIKQNPEHAIVTNGMLRELGDEELTNEFGFEAGLARAAEDTDNVSASEEGSTITDPAPLSAEALAVPTSEPVAGVVGQVPAQPEAVTETVPVAESTETAAEPAKAETAAETSPAAEPAAEAKTAE